ncbi:hypothetical protein [Flagellimonas sp. CMM7]|uniref:hypothetical protein n=1 Tax=Flagellimonas sp. CMM7 TaxID=2654676 RepID=UPI0013D71F9F|nr:hypothetical protein [Flagellimonas sp. CMM7]UII80381.1 hypothetical protein LV704_02435 [Flagellimonas sp. CMM7]
MNIKNLFLSICVLAIGAMLTLNSCSGDDDSPADPDPVASTCPVFTVANADCFCAENPNDANCQTPEPEPEPEPFDPMDLNGLGVIIDFEDVDGEIAKVFTEDFFSPSGRMGRNDATDIPAFEGNNYLRLISPASESVLDADGNETTDARNFHDFKYWPSSWDDDPDNNTDATIDFTDLTDPHLNFWVNTGTAQAGLGIMFQTINDDRNDQWIYEHIIDFPSTDNEWKLYSLSIAEMIADDSQLVCCPFIPDQPTGVPNLDATHNQIKFFVIPKDIGATVDSALGPDDFITRLPAQDYALRVDLISLTDGPAPQPPMQ